MDPARPPLERFGRYVILELLGRGGAGRVDLALTLDGGECPRLVVLKRMLLTSDDGDDGRRRQFLAEARLCALFSHPNLVSVFDVEQVGDQVAIVMEHLQGHSLAAVARAHFKNGTSLPVPVVLGVVRDALLGLQCAHEATDYFGRPLGLVHRDFTPDNIFVTTAGHAKVLDFGIAKLQSSDTRTGTGLLKGKLGYMAPEQLLAEPMDRRADVFAAGVILWELLAGRRLGRGRSLYEVVTSAHDPVPSLRDVVPGIDEGLAAIVERAAAIERDDRYPTVAALLAALDAQGSKGWVAATPGEIGSYVDALLGDVSRAMEERVREHYTRALQSLEEDEPPTSQAATAILRAPSDAPVTTASHRSDHVPRQKLRRAFWVSSLVALVALAAVPFAVRSRLDSGSSSHSAPAARVAVSKIIHDSRWESLLLQPTARASDDRSRPPAAHTSPDLARPPPAPIVPEPAKPGFLSLDTYPWSEVTIDGQLYGATPLLHIPLAPGPHLVRVENAEHRLVRVAELQVTSDELIARRWGLE